MKNGELYYCVILEEGRIKGSKNYVKISGEDAMYAWNALDIMGVGGDSTEGIEMGIRYDLTIRCQDEEGANGIAKKLNLPSPFHKNLLDSWILNSDGR